MSKMPVPDDLLEFFARQKKGTCAVTYDAGSVTLSANGKSKTLARPCSMPEIEAAAREIAK